MAKPTVRMVVVVYPVRLVRLLWVRWTVVFKGDRGDRMMMIFQGTWKQSRLRTRMPQMRRLRLRLLLRRLSVWTPCWARQEEEEEEGPSPLALLLL
jgi:hypothetical protein